MYIELENDVVIPIVMKFNYLQFSYMHVENAVE